MYILLVGDSGVGKSTAIRPVKNLWYELKKDGRNWGQHLGPTNVSKAAMIDNLNKSERKIITELTDTKYNQFNSMYIASGEFGSFLSQYDGEFMNTLTDVYDCEPYTESKRTKSLEINIDNPQLNIVGGTTPSWLHSFMPEGAWSQGFISRVIIVYSGEAKGIIDPFEIVPDGDADLWDNLKNDLRLIGNLHGKMEYTKEAVDLIRTWIHSGGKPHPEHIKLKYYLTRS